MQLIDVFSGCGGLTEGFVRAGFEPVLAVESNSHAAATYEANFGPHVLCEDIFVVPDGALPDAEIVVGGPPCQGFSNLGTRDPADPRNRLWEEFVRVVAAVKPLVFVLENVPRFLKSDQFGMLRQEAAGGALDGYELATAIINAADYGVPQRRRRAFVIGSKVGRPAFPRPTHGEGTNWQWVGLREALAGVPLEPGPSKLPDREVQPGIPGPFKAPEIHVRRNPEEISLRRYDCIPPGGNRFNLPDKLKPPCWLSDRSSTTDVMGRLLWDEPALTIRTEFWKPEKGRYLHPEWSDDEPERRVNRAITHWEAARIQTFDDDFVWCGSKVEIARQIGNAVPPALAETLARQLLNEIDPASP